VEKQVRVNVWIVQTRLLPWRLVLILGLVVIVIEALGQVDDI
jgi:hypothetical protein